MHALKKDKFVYIAIPKNGKMTFSGLLSRHGWETIDLFENDLDLSKCFLWGHLTEPNKRHTRGVEQYLRLNKDVDFNDPTVAKMLASGIFDEHGYSVHMLLAPVLHHPIYWIPLDAQITNWNTNGKQVLNGNDLTNEFFKEHNLDIVVTDQDIDNRTPKDRLLVQEAVAEIKKRYEHNYNSLVKNLLDPDIILYNNVVKNFRIKYGSTE